jgi:hypothetical protein
MLCLENEAIAANNKYQSTVTQYINGCANPSNKTLTINTFASNQEIPNGTNSWLIKRCY